MFTKWAEITATTPHFFSVWDTNTNFGKSVAGIKAQLALPRPTLSENRVQTGPPTENHFVIACASFFVKVSCVYKLKRHCAKPRMCVSFSLWLNLLSQPTWWGFGADVYRDFGGQHSCLQNCCVFICFCNNYCELLKIMILINTLCIRAKTLKLHWHQWNTIITFSNSETRKSTLQTE